MTSLERPAKQIQTPEFSRFATNVEKGEALPVFPLLELDNEGGLGAILVGDYVANDFVNYQLSQDPDFRDKWLVVSTTQSDVVPDTVDMTDCNIFSNASGVERYLQGAARDVPYSLELADGLFVDPDIFTPPQDGQEVDHDILYMAKWYPTKKTELLIDVAQSRPDIRIGIYGWLMASERKRKTSETYREEIMGAAALLDNVTIYNAEDFSSTESHVNEDGSTVLGPLSKPEVRDRFMYRSDTGIYLSEETEAVNRFGTEMLMCDKPLIVALPTYGGMERFMVDGETSLFCERTPESIAGAYDSITENRDQFTPRETLLEFGGKPKANQKLKEILEELAHNRGKNLSSAPWNTYSGDLWTLPSTYGKIR
jgi:glycosyltransferase involved in cell wall biosynthesis